jgi:ABC-2 type transport system permease protein
MRRFLTVTEGVAWRSAHNAFSNPAFLLPSLLFPLFFLAAFAGGLSAVGDVPGFDYEPGYSIARDFENGFAQRLMLAAPNRSGIIAGYAIAALLRWLVTAAVVTAAALIGGMDVPGQGVDLFGLLVLGMLANVTAILWACGVAMRLRSESAGSLIQMPVFLILFLAPVYVPVELLNGWVEAVAKINPATAVLEAGRSLLAGSPEEVGLALGVFAVGITVMSVWARTGLRSAERAGGS